MSTRTKPQPDALATATTDRELADAEHATALEAVETARNRADELRGANAAGDASISALDLLAADAEIPRAEGLAGNAAARLAEARKVEQDLIAELVAAEVAASFSPEAVEQRIAAATTKVAEGIAELKSAIYDRDAACDAAGRRLASVGVPFRTQVGRISYRPVVQGLENRVVPGKYNVTLDGQALTKRQGQWHTAEGAHRLTFAALRDGLNAVGWRTVPAMSGVEWNGYDVRDRP